MGSHDLPSQGDFTKRQDFYADSAVVAYRLPDSDIDAASLSPKITTSAAAIDPTALSDGDYTHGGRGLKRVGCPCRWPAPGVASHAGAWIETTISTRCAR